MSYHVDDKTTVFMKKSKEITNMAELDDAPDKMVHQRVIDLVAQKRNGMCKANPGGDWELNLSADIKGNIKIIKLKTQANIVVKIKYGDPCVFKIFQHNRMLKETLGTWIATLRSR